MREDLPGDDPLPTLWSICLFKGGDLVVDPAAAAGNDIGTSPRLCLYKVVDAVNTQSSEPRKRCWRVEGKEDGVRHILSELRLDFPEDRAIFQLGSLRELMLREARLLDSLDHDFVIPLECGWLEQRTDYSPLCPGSSFLDGRQATCAIRPTSNTGHEEEMSNERAVHACSRQQQSAAKAVGSDNDLSAAAPSSLVESQRSSCALTSCDEDPVAVLRACVPWAVGEEDSDNGSSSDTDDEGKWGSEISTDGMRRHSREREGDEKSRWGGDDSTHWIGTAEPKTTPLAGACRTARIPPPRQLPSVGTRPVARGQNFDQNRTLSSPCAAQQQSMICIAAYLLLPDALTLGEWLDTEFEPKLAPDGQGVTMAVTGTEDWLMVWQQLVNMFLQVVRGVEHLHVQGIVHNGISTASVWVSSNGTCRVGDMGQATPPGRRRPAAAVGPLSYFSSVERRRGGRIESHSDVYSLGVLMLEFWCRYLHARGFGKLSVGGERGMLEIIKSEESESVKPDSAKGVLDVDLLRRMLADNPFERPDCFEVIDALDGSLSTP